jgi:hypothetical protein
VEVFRLHKRGDNLGYRLEGAELLHFYTGGHSERCIWAFFFEVEFVEVAAVKTVSKFGESSND